MVVISIAALLFQVVVANIGAWLPDRALDSEARQLVSQLDYLRSEARLQGKSYALELDLTNHRYRVILPPEERVLSSQAIPDQSNDDELSYGWTDLGDRVEFRGYRKVNDADARSYTVKIEFDNNGFTADQAIFLQSVKNPDLVWTIRLYGLTGTCEVLRQYDGREMPLDIIDEGSFR